MARNPITSSNDVVAYLTAQHRAIRAQFVETVEAKNDKVQQAAFSRLRTLLAVHETAEAMMVHPRVSRKIDGGAVVADARLAEENDVQAALAELAHIPCGTADFTKRLVGLQSAVLAHAEREEREEFVLLAEHIDGDELDKMTTAVQLAERIESNFVNVAAGPYSSILDRARDLLRGSSA